MKPGQRPVTMRMVAEAVGLSTVAVSLALRNHPSIPEKTRSRIRKMASRLGYRVNPLVSTLMAQLHTRRGSAESPILSLILEEGYQETYSQVPFYRDLIEGARHRAVELGYQLENNFLRMEKKSATALHRSIHSRNVRGVVIAPLFHPSGECPLPLEGLACCALGYSLHQPDIHRAVPNYAQTMRLAWQKLLEKGYRRPGFISSLYHLERTYFERLGAFTAQQATHPELKTVPPLIFRKAPDDYPAECLEQLLRWFHRYQPDALIFPPWILLDGIGRHLRIPQDAGVILADVEPGWTLAKEGAHEIGAAAVDMVVAQIHRNETGVPKNPKTVSINSEWIDGFSLPTRR